MLQAISCSKSGVQNQVNYIMKLLKTLFVLSIIFMAGSCAERTVIKTDVRTPGERLFEKAENNFNSASYDKALKLYALYLEKHPEQSLAPAALLKTGVIFSVLKKYADARETYHKMIQAYPDSSYISDGMVEILVTYYNEGNYKAVIEKSYDVPENLEPNDYIIRKYAIVGDAYLGMDSPVLAVDSFISAYKKADSSENIGVILRLRKALGKLSDEEIIRFLDSIEDEEIRGYFIFQRCINALQKKNNDDVLRMLTGFIKLFPSHILTIEAATLKEKLVSTDYNLYLVGCLLPTSGKYESYGVKAQMGFDLAYNDFSINKKNPVVRVLYRDTGSDAEKTRAAVREFAELGVAAIIGPIGTVEAAADEAQLRGVPIITLTGKENITEVGDYVFRNFLTRRMQVKSIVSYAFEVLGVNNFAILYPDEAYGQDMMTLFWDEVKDYNGDIVGVEAYKPLSTDFATPIKKLTGMYYKISKEPPSEGENPDEEEAGAEDLARMVPQVDFDAVFIPDSSAEVGLILPQLSFYDVGDVYLLGTNLWHSEKLIERAGKNATHSVIPDGFFAGSAEPEVQSFVKNFNDVFEEIPGFIEAISYDSAMIVFNIIKNAGVETPGDFRDKLLELRDYKGVTGSTSFDETGDVWKQLYLLKVEDKAFVECPR